MTESTLFIGKTFLAALLALFISFRLQLAAPSTAMVTVFIIAQPQSGLIIAKGFYRILGTSVGSLMSVLLIALCAQSPALFLFCLSLWVGLCVAGAAWFRDFQAYAFMLAGYTACLIGFPAIQNPDATFSLAINRVSEIYVGILCTAIIGDVLWPQRLTPLLVQRVRQQYHDLLSFLQKAVATPLDHSIQDDDAIAFVVRILELEPLRAAAIFEDPQSRLRSDRLRLFSADFMRLTSTLHALQQMGRRLRAQGQLTVLAALRPIIDSLAGEMSLQGHIPQCAAEASPLLRQLTSLRPWLAQRLSDAGQRYVLNTAELQDFQDASALLTRLVDELFTLTATYASLLDRRHRPTRPAPRLNLFTARGDALIAGLRAVLAMLALNAFWISTAWPQGGGAATIACVACALFATAPQPQRAVLQMGLGFALGLIAATLLNLVVLPLLSGFAGLALGLLPFICGGLWLASRPTSAGLGIAFCMMLSNALPLQNFMHYDGVLLLNNGLSQLLGLSVAGIAFSLLQRSQVAQQRRYYHRHLTQQLADVCAGRRRHLPHRFDGRIRDLMRLILQRSPALVPELMPRALAVLEFGDALIDMRLQAGDVATRAALRPSLALLAAALRRPSWQRREQAIASLTELLQRLDSAAPAEHPALLAALRRALRILTDTPWLAAPDIPATDAPGVLYAT